MLDQRRRERRKKEAAEAREKREAEEARKENAIAERKAWLAEERRAGKEARALVAAAAVGAARPRRECMRSEELRQLRLLLARRVSYAVLVREAAQS